MKPSDTPTQPNDDRKAVDELRNIVELKFLWATHTMADSEKQGVEDCAIQLITASNRQLLQTVLDRLPAKKSHIESDRNIAYREGFNDSIHIVTAIINEIMGGLV